MLLIVHCAWHTRALPHAQQHGMAGRTYHADAFCLPFGALLCPCRIDTILDCDHLLVLSNGCLVEQGSPTHLSTGEGVFASMVTAAKAAASKHHH